MNGFLWALVLLAVVAGAWFAMRRRKGNGGIAPDGGYGGGRSGDGRRTDKV